MNKVKKVLGVVLVLGLVFGFTKFSLAEEKGLIGYWKFDEGKGSIAKDSSGMGNDGAISGAAWVKGVSGSALQFDGKGDYVNCGNDESLNVPEAITIEAWVKNDDPDLTGDWAQIISRGVWGRENPFLLGFGNGHQGWGEIYTNIKTTGGGAGGYWEYVLDSEWHHIVFTYDTTDGFKAYVDSLLEYTASAKGAVDNTDALPLGIGGPPRNDVPERYFNGIIDEVRIYNRALTANEIKSHYEMRERRL